MWNWNTPVYWFSYNGDALPHLIQVGNAIGTTESYALTYGSIAGGLASPWGQNYGAASTLASVGALGLGVSHGFVYNGYGEMTGMTTPLGGSLGWTYADGATTTVYREVSQRTGVGNTWTFTPDAGSGMHGSATLADAGAGSSKLWTFGGNGLAATFEEQGPAGVRLVRKEYTWSADANGNVYVGSVVTKLKPGASDEVSSKTAQTLDVMVGMLLESSPDSVGRMPLFARCVPIALQHQVNGFLHRIQLRPLPGVFLSLWRDRIGNRLAHHSPMHPMLLRQSLDRLARRVPAPDLFE